MKKVVYICCNTDPWLKVAQRLKDEYGYEPVYWSGRADQQIEGEKDVKQLFPNVIYHSYENSWRNIFCEEIEEKAKSTYIDVDFLRQFGEEELLAMKMCDRQDVDGTSFNFMERQRNFRNYIRKWQAFIDVYHPELVVSPFPPHQVYDFALYLLCKYYKITYVFCSNTAFKGRFFATKDHKTIGGLFKDDYLKFLDRADTLNVIPQDILDNYNTLKRNYNEGVPSFMAMHKEVDRHSQGIVNLFKKFLADSKHGKGKQSAFEVIKDGMNFNGKKRGVSLEKSHYSFWDYCLYKLESSKQKKELSSYYGNLVVKPDFTQKYILLGLHYQPEATTCPMGDIYVDQRLCVDELLKNTPSDYLIYIKEHPTQFYQQFLGQTNRNKEFYDDLNAIPRVRLISSDEPTFPLIQHAQAVATITGTVGWESIVYQKPTIVFGHSWYENCPLVLNVKRNIDSSKIGDYIEHYKYSEKQLMAYLAAVGENTYFAYYNRPSEKYGLSEEECADELLRVIVDNLN